MVVGPAIGRDEVRALRDAAVGNPGCAIGLHATLTAPFRPLTMHFQPIDGGMFLSFQKLLIAGLLRRLDPEDPVRYDFSVCHLGMMNACGFSRPQADAQCPLRGACRPRQGSRKSQRSTRKSQR